MLLALVLGFTLAIVGMTLVRQYLEGAMREVQPPALTAAEFPRLAPPTRLRTVSRATRPMTYPRRAA